MKTTDGNMNELNSNTDKREKIFSEISKDDIQTHNNILDKKNRIVRNSFNGSIPPKLSVEYETIKTQCIINAEQYFIRKFKDRGFECYKTQSSEINEKCSNNNVINFLKEEKRNGIPDLVVFNSDRFFFIEVKTGTQSLLKSQVEWIRNHKNIEVIVYYLSQKLVKEVDGLDKDIIRENIFLDVSKRDNIRSKKPEYRLILDALQTISPTTIKELQEEINNDYNFELFTYKQLYDNIQALVYVGVIENDTITKQISINPDYISYPESLPISSYCIYIFSISAIFLIVSLATKTMLSISLPVFVVGIFYLIAQHFGSKFDFKR